MSKIRPTVLYSLLRRRRQYTTHPTNNHQKPLIVDADAYLLQRLRGGRRQDPSRPVFIFGGIVAGFSVLLAGYYTQVLTQQMDELTVENERLKLELRELKEIQQLTAGLDAPAALEGLKSSTEVPSKRGWFS
ncbi:hypothetical protein DFS34DRAFT_649945 [Phlyctochytrium arcticum]|nr:hypothetical protein DFS34DRAFT_649945 [Phlyctochytrium arcticum]